MRSVLPLICAAGFLVAACDGPDVRISSTETTGSPRGVLKVVDTLQCPETQGVLTRKGSALPGGKVCTYTGPKGAEVSLHLVALNGVSPSSVLDGFETQLTQGLPHTAADLSVQKAEAARAEAESARAEAESTRAEAEAEASAVAAGDDRARVRLPGLTIDAEGEKARVRIGSLSIRADDSAGTVDIRSDDDRVSVNATDDGAEVRTRAGGDATRSTWILTDSRPSAAGWRMVGYEARGPAGGPIVVATVRTKEREHDRVWDAAKALVELNVGR